MNVGSFWIAEPQNSMGLSPEPNQTPHAYFTIHRYPESRSSASGIENY